MYPLHKSSAEQFIAKLLTEAIQLFLYPQIFLTGYAGRQFRVQMLFLPFQLRRPLPDPAGIYRVCKAAFHSNPSFFRPCHAVDFLGARLTVNLHAPGGGRAATHESPAGAFGIPEWMPPNRRRE